MTYINFTINDWATSVSLDEAERIITNLTEKVKEAKTPKLPKADAYYGHDESGKRVYFAEVPNNPGHYTSGSCTAAIAVNDAKAATGSDRGNSLSYWVNRYGPVIRPVKLFTVEEYGVAITFPS